MRPSAPPLLLVLIAVLPVAASSSSSSSSSAAAGASSSSAWSRARCGPADLVTAYGAAVAPPFAGLLAEYPRPLMVRGDPAPGAPGARFATLHGLWQWEPARNGSTEPSDPPFGRQLNGTILVPFAPESCLSGVGYLSAGPPRFPDFAALWYRLVFDNPLSGGGGTGGGGNASAAFLLNLEAVDWQSTVFLNGARLGATHTGGYDAAQYDATALLRPAGNELLVFAFDPTERGAQPQGKQLTLSEAKCGTDGEKYVPASGIWGAVWLESAPLAARIADVRLRSNATAVRVWVDAAPAADAFGAGATVNITVSLRGGPVLTLTAPFVSGAPVDVLVPAPETWSAARPTLYDAVITVASAAASAAAPASASAPPALSDSVQSYFGLRSVGLESYERPELPALGPLFNYSLGGVAVLPGSPFALPPGADWPVCEAACFGNRSINCTGWIYTRADCAGGAAAAPSPTPTCALKGQVGLSLVPQQACSIAGKAAVPAGPAARPTVNGEPVFFAAWLDQSYWPDGGFTAPSDEALASDLVAAKAFGFNAVRMHTKASSRRWYHHADRLGIFVLQDFVQKFLGEGVPGNATETVPLFLADAAALVAGRGSHPSVVQWTLFNEGDCVGLFDVPAVVAWAEALDGLGSAHGALGMGRLVDTNSGGGADALGLAQVHDEHTYPWPGAPLPSATQFAMLGEWGGFG